MRPVLAALLALTLTVPAFSGPVRRPVDALADARSELAAIESIVQDIPDWRMRSALTTHVHNARYALDQVRVDRPPRPDHLGARCPVDALRFDDALSLVQAATWDSDRVAMVERIGRNACLTTDQARTLVALFDWDSSKERALIALYPAVTDKARYVMALDVLTWESSRQSVATALGI